jgi:dTDP-4-dehydrorhamnose 3,5-epimerase
MVSNLIKLSTMGDKRGSLIALEQNDNVPFNVDRVFFIYGTKKGVSRGQHAHYKTKQLLICVSGECRVKLDNGKTQIDYHLNSPNIGLIQNEMIWCEMYDFSRDCVLLVLANTPYNAKDYIDDYEEFLINIAT